MLNFLAIFFFVFDKCKDKIVWNDTYLHVWINTSRGRYGMHCVFGFFVFQNWPMNIFLSTYATFLLSYRFPVALCFVEAMKTVLEFCSHLKFCWLKKSTEMGKTFKHQEAYRILAKIFYSTGIFKNAIYKIMNKVHLPWSMVVPAFCSKMICNGGAARHFNSKEGVPVLVVRILLATTNNVIVQYKCHLLIDIKCFD